MVLGAVAVVTLLTSVVLYRSFLVLSFNEQKARVLGLRPQMAHMAMLGLITLSIVGSFQTVGALLVFGLLVGPAATAAIIVNRVPSIMILAALLGVVSVASGLVISYYANTSASATVALVPILLFFAVLAVKSVVGSSAEA